MDKLLVSLAFLVIGERSGVGISLDLRLLRMISSLDRKLMWCLSELGSGFSLTWLSRQIKV